MMILVINAGSSSLKYQLFDMDHEKVLCKGNCERIGLEKSVIGHKTSDGKQIEKEIDDMITAYRGGNLLINIVGDDPRQTSLEL